MDSNNKTKSKSKPQIPVTVRDTIADPLQDKIIQAGENVSSNLWTLGELTEEAVAEKAPKVPTGAILVNCGILSGLSAARMGDLRATSNFYPSETRDKYQSLTHSHFFVAKAAGDLDKALEYLRVAEESADQYGGIRMPVGKLAAQISEDNRDEDPPPEWYRYMRAVYSNAKKIEANRGMEDIPVGIEEYIGELIDGLEEDFDGEEFLNG